MRLFADQDLFVVTIRFLRDLGHDLVLAADFGLSSRTDDVDVLQAAHDQGRIFVTRDRDFGALVFVQGAGPGVIYLRMQASTLDAVHAEFARVLSLYSEAELQTAFVVVEPGGHRIRKLGSTP